MNSKLNGLHLRYRFGRLVWLPLMMLPLVWGCSKSPAPEETSQPSVINNNDPRAKNAPAAPGPGPNDVVPGRKGGG